MAQHSRRVPYESSYSTGSGSGGIGFTGLLQVAFIILKLCHVIDWSWWWVLAPTWISYLILVIILIVILVYGMIVDKHIHKGETTK